MHPPQEQIEKDEAEMKAQEEAWMREHEQEMKDAKAQEERLSTTMLTHESENEKKNENGAALHNAEVHKEFPSMDATEDKVEPLKTASSSKIAKSDKPISVPSGTDLRRYVTLPRNWTVSTKTIPELDLRESVKGQSGEIESGGASDQKKEDTANMTSMERWLNEKVTDGPWNDIDSYIREEDLDELERQILLLLTVDQTDEEKKRNGWI